MMLRAQATLSGLPRHLRSAILLPAALLSKPKIATRFSAPRVVLSDRRRQNDQAPCFLVGASFASWHQPLFSQNQQQQWRNYDSKSKHTKPADDAQTLLLNARPLCDPPVLKRVLRSPSLHAVGLLSILAAFVFYFSNLETVPITGRVRFNYHSRSSVRSTADMEFKKVLYELEKSGRRILSPYDSRTRMVRKVLDRLIPFSGGLDDQEWELFVVDDPGTANAFVLPGGRVFVFSGIFSLTRSESGLAGVLGHEMAHDLAGHVGERMSQSGVTSLLLWSVIFLTPLALVGSVLHYFLGQRLLDIAFGMPMGRMQESEADYLGLMMMSEACYDPRESLRFWQRMAYATQRGEVLPEWLSTHPSNESRIQKIQEWMPKAIEKRAESNCATSTAFADLFRQAMQKGAVLQRR